MSTTAHPPYLQSRNFFPHIKILFDSFPFLWSPHTHTHSRCFQSGPYRLANAMVFLPPPAAIFHNQIYKENVCSKPACTHPIHAPASLTQRPHTHNAFACASTLPRISYTPNISSYICKPINAFTFLFTRCVWRWRRRVGFFFGRYFVSFILNDEAKPHPENVLVSLTGYFVVVRISVRSDFGKRMNSPP